MKDYETPDKLRYPVSFFQPQTEKGMEMVDIGP